MNRRGGLVAGLYLVALLGAEIAIFGGIGDATTLVRSQVPVDVPVVMARVAVALSIGLGCGLVVAAVLRLRRLPVRQRALRPAES